MIMPNVSCERWRALAQALPNPIIVRPPLAQALPSCHPEQHLAIEDGIALLQQQQQQQLRIIEQ